jgi:uncharacterized protein
MSLTPKTGPKTANIKLAKTSRIIVLSVIGITIIHTIYMNLMGFSSLSHDACLVYQSVPRWFFYLYENVLELFIVVILGVFAGVLMEQYFNKIKRFYPNNQLLAFAYAAILPVCSCGVVPLIESMKARTSLKTIITFVIAAPLLNPYIVLVSFTVLGVKYALLRIITSFLLAVISGWLVELISKQFRPFAWGQYQACATDCEVIIDKDPFVKTIKLTRKLLPYIIIAGVISFAFALINPKQYLEQMSFSHEPWSTLIMIVVGIPIYVCNGTDVVFLKPLLQYTDLTMGSAIAFSLASSAVCVSSIAMLVKFIGRNLTIALVGVITILIFIFSMLINVL